LDFIDLYVVRGSFHQDINALIESESGRIHHNTSEEEGAGGIEVPERRPNIDTSRSYYHSDTV
jgi:hypothetical protein